MKNEDSNKYFVVLLLVLFSSVNLMAQEPVFTTSPFYDFYSQNNLSAVSCGKGLTGIAENNDIGGILLNPASLDLQTKFQMKTEYSLRSYPGKVSFLKQGQPAGGILFGYKINDNFQTGFTYRNDINIKFGDAASFNSHTFSIPLVYKYKFLKAGININYTLYRNNYLSYDNSGNSISVSETFRRFIPDLGIQLKPIKEISFGLNYTQGFDNNINDGSSYYLITHYPSKFSAGILFNLFEEKLKLETDYKFENTSKNYKMKNRNDFYFGAEYSADKNLNLRAGLFTLLSYFHTERPNVETESNIDSQYFLTLGAGYKINNFNIDIAIMSSTLISISNVSHTKLNGSVSYSF